MTAFDWFQIVADLGFLFLILLLLVSRAWKRGAGNEADQESYREMIETLSALIREMKEASRNLEERIAEKQGEVTGAITAADSRIERLKDLLAEMEGVVSSRGPDSESPQKVPLANREETTAKRVPDIGMRIRDTEHPGSRLDTAVEEVSEKPARKGRRRSMDARSEGDRGSAPAEPGGVGDHASAAGATPDEPEDEDERREKYRQALDFARKGWDILDIARFTGLPRGEVDLLVRTKGKKV